MFLPGFLSPVGARGSSSRVKSPRGSRNPSPSPSRSQFPRPSEYIADESQLRTITPLPADVQDLNKCLEILAATFPDIQVEVFREMLGSFSEESRLAVVADAMLKNPANWVKGRRRARSVQKEGLQQVQQVLVPRNETFRSQEYRDAVRHLALQEFKGLSKSSIDAVLSESNYSYLDARPTLVNLSFKSWKFAISSVLFRRKPVTSSEAENHPLVIWKSSGHGSIIPTLKSTGNAELDKELFEELIMPLKRQEAAAREDKDHDLAMSLNTEEAEVCEATFECACCYTDATFEEFTTCNAEGHMICFRCVQHSITEAVFGQGWARSIIPETGTLRCPAVASKECEGCISAEHIYRAMQEEKKGAEILRKLDQRLAEHSLLKTGLRLIRCPFCDYAEIDDLYVPSKHASIKLRASNLPNIILTIISLCLLPVTLPLMVICLCCLLACVNAAVRAWFAAHFRAAITRYRRRRIGLRFTCQNPQCGRPSCLACSKAWVDIHVCHESSLVALRTQVEQAMSMAIKRVCPRCNTSFVKTAGCNKLTCPCGYKMCYVCRKDIGGSNEGYQHFCQHFRPEGDGRQCTECKKCNLWEAEDTEAILKAAKAAAQKKWLETENRQLSEAERAYLETGIASKKDENAVNRFFSAGKLPSMEDVCDSIVETLFVVTP